MVLNALALALSIAPVALVKAQQNAESAAPGVAATSLQDLAKAAKNPFLDAIKLPIQITSGFDIGSQHKIGEDLNIQPLLPFALNSNWDLIARPNLNLVYESGPQHQFGLQDLQGSFFLTPALAKDWVWGIGPVLQVPSATSKALGTGRWAAGPTAAIVYQEGPWFAGLLTYQLLSFAGDRSRGSINQTYLEPQVSYNFESGWYIQCDPAMTFDWTASQGNGWDIPAGIDIGTAFQIGTRAMTLQVGGYDFVKYPDQTPRWILRMQLTLLFSQ
jgi:hypothetical protein